MKHAVMMLCALCAFLAGCGKGLREEEALAQYHASGKETVQEMLDVLKGLDARAPRFLQADFSIEGARREKKFRMIGSLQYDRPARAMHASFSDYIFRTSILVFFAEGDDLRLYFPVEKKLFVESMRGIDLGDYGGPSMAMDIVLSLATGNIPLLAGYRVKQGLRENNGEGTMLLLENPRYYQTVSFRNGLPDKVLIIDRETRERFEIYFKKRINSGDVSYVEQMVMVASQTGLRIDLRLKSVRTGGSIKVPRARDMKLPPDVRTISRM